MLLCFLQFHFFKTRFSNNKVVNEFPFLLTGRKLFYIFRHSCHVWVRGWLCVLLGPGADLFDTQVSTVLQCHKVSYLFASVIYGSCLPSACFFLLSSSFMNCLPLDSFLLFSRIDQERIFATGCLMVISRPQLDKSIQMHSVFSFF